MKWILVWWIVAPHHAQVMHLEHYDTEYACLKAGESLKAPPNKIVRWHCAGE